MRENSEVIDIKLRSEEEILASWKMQEPLVSICCLTYNHEKYIDYAIRGFLSQETDFPFEIIIHDDASKDCTAEIVKQYYEKYPSIIKPIFQETNQYSKGIEVDFVFVYPLLKGAYIAFCEGDDYWIDPDKLSKQVNFLHTHREFSICFTYSKKIDSTGMEMEVIENLKPIIYTNYDFIVGRKFQTRTCTVVLRRCAYDFGWINKFKIYNKDNFIRIIGTESGKGIVLPYITAVYRVHSGGIWSMIPINDKLNRLMSDLKVKLKYAKEKEFKAVPPLALNLLFLYLRKLHHRYF